MNVNAALQKLANAQKALYKITVQMMKDDKCDGIRWAKLLEKHADVTREIIEEANLHGDITDAEAEALEAINS